MDLETIKTFGQVGGVAGLALAALIMIFRTIIKKMLSEKMKLPAEKIFQLFALMIVCVTMVTIVGIGAWVFVSMRQKDTVKSLEQPTVETLKPLKPRDRELVQALVSGNTTGVDQLLKEGANPNAKDADGQTPLHYAATKQNPALVDRLIESGAIAGVKNNLGVTPYGVADFKGESAIQSKLMAARKQ